MALCQQNHCLYPAGVILQKPPQVAIYISLSAAPGKGEGQHGSGRKAAQGRECGDMAFPFLCKAR